MRCFVLGEGGGRGGEVRGTGQIRDLLNFFKRSASTPRDNITCHFLGAALTPTLEVSCVYLIPYKTGHFERTPF